MTKLTNFRLPEETVNKITILSMFLGITKTKVVICAVNIMFDRTGLSKITESGNNETKIL